MRLHAFTSPAAAYALLILLWVTYEGLCVVTENGKILDLTYEAVPPLPFPNLCVPRNATGKQLLFCISSLYDVWYTPSYLPVIPKISVQKN